MLTATLGVAVGASGVLEAQGAVDPNVVPRATAMVREGRRMDATELLGRYLATAPGDGRAWFHLGRLYLLGARDWHTTGHTGDPSGSLFLDLSALALDQALQLQVDSGVVFRAMVDLDRDVIAVELRGWEAVRDARPTADRYRIPDYLLELGANLLGSCPANGVIVTGNDLETMAVWYAALEAGVRKDVLPMVPRLYATDSLYRNQMAGSLGVDPAWSVQRALTKVAESRPMCLTPFAERAAVPLPEWQPMRLVLAGGADVDVTTDVLTVTSLLREVRTNGSVWSRSTLAIYGQAAKENILLCHGILAVLGEPRPATCGR
ncbi:MAG: hypothetical protein HKM89_08385 [Gemmatimonadales bacterium]|nr:hypothetical protein [Gemmatimonadales bacterium]